MNIFDKEYYKNRSTKWQELISLAIVGAIALFLAILVILIVI